GGVALLVSAAHEHVTKRLSFLVAEFQDLRTFADRRHDLAFDSREDLDVRLDTPGGVNGGSDVPDGFGVHFEKHACRIYRTERRSRQNLSSAGCIQGCVTRITRAAFSGGRER